MKIIEAIQQLEQIMRKEGEDLELYMEIGENVSCKQCGETKYKMRDGWCKKISTINMHKQGISVLLSAGDEE